MATNIREKIQKLLALSKSPNEHEAQAAMLKARELIAKHKLDERDFENKKEEKVIKRVEIKGISYSMRRDSWLLKLKNIIAANYCCDSYATKDERTYYIRFVGFEADIELCVDVFWYAYNCVKEGIKKEQKKYVNLSGKDKSVIANSYGYGFCEGLKEAFDKQNQENEKEWGLVLTVPKEVTDMVDNITKLKKEKPKALNNLNKNVFDVGKKDGEQFTIRKKLGEENDKIE